MHEKTWLYNLLEKHRIELTGPIVSDQADGGLLIFIRSSLSKDGKRVPTSHLLGRIMDECNSLGISVTFVRVDEDNTDLDGSLKTMLLSKYEDYIRNSFASFHGKVADVWIEPKIQLEQAKGKEIFDKARTFIELVGFEIGNISFTSVENLPSSTAIMRALRILAPCDLPTLRSALQLKGFAVLNEVWLSHNLDKIRKQGHIIRRKDGKYFLTLQGLTLLGTEKSSRSPDILRALALPRRD